MRTTRLLTVSCSIPCILGGLPNPPEADPPPLKADPAPLEADSPPLKVDPPTLEADPPPPPGGRTPTPGGRTPPGHVTCDVCWEATPLPSHTHVCENILPKLRLRAVKIIYYLFCFRRISSLVSTYVVCERLSVIQQPARLPENFDQISPKHPCSGIWFQNTPPPRQIKIIPRVQVQPYPEHPAPKWKTLTFFPEFRSELTQNTPHKWKTNFLSWVQIWVYPEHPPQNEKLTFVPEFRSELTQNPPPQRKNSNFLSWVQIWAYPEHPPNENLTFFPEFRSELTKNTPPPMKI